MTQPASSSNDDTTMTESSNDTDTTPKTASTTTVKETKVKLLFKLKKTDHLDEAIGRHMNTLIEMHEHDPDMSILDKNNVHIVPALIRFEDFRSHFEYHTLPRRHHQLIAVTHSIKSSYSLGDIKESIRGSLSLSRTTLLPQVWPTLDIRDIGWFHAVHPRFHSRKEIENFLHSLLVKKNPNINIPTFRLYVKTIIYGKPNDLNRIATPAIHAECQSEHVSQL